MFTKFYRQFEKPDFSTLDVSGQVILAPDASNFVTVVNGISNIVMFTIPHNWMMLYGEENKILMFDSDWGESEKLIWFPGGVSEEQFFQSSLVDDVKITFEDNYRLSMMYQLYHKMVKVS